MEGEAIVFHLVWKRGIVSQKVYHDPFQRGGNLISALLMTLMDFPLLTMRTKTSLLIHSANLKNWIGLPLQWTMGWIIKRIIKIRKASVIFQMTYGRKALRNSESLSGTDVLVIWKMVFFMCWGLILSMSWVMWGNALYSLGVIFNKDSSRLSKNSYPVMCIMLCFR